MSSTPVTTRRRRTRRHRLAVSAVAIALGTLGSACSSGGGTPTAAEAPTATTVAPASTDRPAAPTTTVAPAEAEEPTEHLVVRSDRDLDVFDRPDGAVARRLPATNELGSPLALLVVDDRPGWVEVLLPGRPTGATAWVPTGEIELRKVDVEIHVDLAARRLRLVEGDTTLVETEVAIGAPDAPTPTGRFSLTDKIRSVDPGGAYGPFALGLSGRSEVLTDFAGGDGQIGIHGTNDPGSIGKDVSHGCIRVPNDVIEVLNERLPLGTPVVIS